MDRTTVLNAIAESAAELLKVDPATVTEQASWAEDLDADSLDLTELVMALEDRFGIEVPEENLEGVTTVGEAVDVILAETGAAAAS